MGLTSKPRKYDWNTRVCTIENVVREHVDSLIHVTNDKNFRTFFIKEGPNGIHYTEVTYDFCSTLGKSVYH